MFYLQDEGEQTTEAETTTSEPVEEPTPVKEKEENGEIEKLDTKEETLDAESKEE